MVVCKDTTHAKSVYDLVSSVDFFNGEYNGKVLQIDSTTRNEELIENQFLTLENEENEIEIVIHVNMLKEGWDVTNLYTIVPLRAGNATILVEQTIGRGLRLPFGGERTGVENIDKLTVVAHDNFNKVIEASQNPNSILNKLKFIEIDISKLNERVEVVTVQDMEAVQKELSIGQLNVFAPQIAAEAEVMYEKFVSDYTKNIIQIPRMDLVQGVVTASFEDFNLDTSTFTYEQLNDEIVRIGLKDKSYDVIEVKSGVNFGSPVKLLISELINYSEIDYDTNADLLNKLAKQAVVELEKNLKDGEDIKKLMFQWRSLIANKVYVQMMQNFRLHEPEYIKPNVKGFTKIEQWNFTTLKNEGHKDYRDESFPAIQVPKFIFRGFEKACHFEYKFDSRTEQTFSFILENDKDVLKWLRPAPNQFRIYWNHNSKLYLPDFIAETADTIYLIETKRQDEIASGEVQEKAKSALKYCKYATEFTQENQGKPWKYVLIPHDKVTKTSSFKALSSQYVQNKI